MSVTGSGVSKEAVEWGFRLLAGRTPVNKDEFNAFLALPDLDAMRRAFTNIGGFHAFFDSVMTGAPTWRAPLFLLRPSEVQGLEWRFQPPDLDNPVSQLCTAAQYAEPTYAEIVEAMGMYPAPSRVLWEQAWIISVIATAGLIAPGKRGLGIETAHERIAAVAAARGVGIQAIGRGVAGTHGAEARRTQLFHPEAVDLQNFDALVRFESLEPGETGRLAGSEFDFVWSVNLPARLGSVEAAMQAFETAMAALRPGGVAAHAFTFNLTSDETTWEFPDLVIVRRRDVEALAARLIAAGHAVLPLNTHPGHAPEDERVKSEPGNTPEHRQRHGLLVSTSFGLAIRKAG